MKKTLLAFIVVACFLNANAQIDYDNSINKFTLSSMRPNKPLLANAAGNLPGTIPNTPSCAFVLEYGNGFFTTEIDPNYTYNLPGTTQVVINYSGRYDTIKPPPAFSKLIFPINTNLVPQQYMQSMLGANEFVRLTPIARSINVSDEMLFILTYKVPQNGNVKLSFFYNDKNLDAFEPINNITETITESLNHQGVTGIVKRIRTYFGEQNLSLGLSPSITPSSPDAVYGNAINWEFNMPAPFTVGREHNIFITLRTKDNIAMPACGQVEAVFVHDSTTSYSTLDMCGSERPHDPNFIVTSPRCIVKGTGTEPVKYRVHFQNEGAGQAYRLNVKVKLDSRLHEAAARLKQPVSFKINIGGKPVNAAGYDYELQPGGIMNFDFPGRLKTSLISRDSSLSCNKVPIWFSNPLTMGDIEFTLDVPKDKEADLAATADIVFYSGPSPEAAMPVVSTQPDTLFVRDKCSGFLYPRPDPIPQPITCCHFLGICWWWWLIIAVAACILIWYVVKRNRRHRRSSYS